MMQAYCTYLLTKMMYQITNSYCTVLVTHVERTYSPWKTNCCRKETPRCRNNSNFRDALQKTRVFKTECVMALQGNIRLFPTNPKCVCNFRSDHQQPWSYLGPVLKIL